MVRQALASAEVGGLASFIAGEISSSCPDLDSEAVLLEEVAAAVADYCLQRHGSAALPFEYLILLCARALCGCGEEHAAQDLLEAYCTIPLRNLCHPDTDAGPRLQALWSGYTEHMVHDEYWRCVAGDPFWVVDVSQLHEAADEILELEVYEPLVRLVSNTLQIFDASSGRGGLGIRGCGALARGLRQAVCSQLSQQAAKRGWYDTPHVIVLSLR